LFISKILQAQTQSKTSNSFICNILAGSIKKFRVAPDVRTRQPETFSQNEDRKEATAIF